MAERQVDVSLGERASFTGYPDNVVIDDGYTSVSITKDEVPELISALQGWLVRNR